MYIKARMIIIATGIYLSVSSQAYACRCYKDTMGEAIKESTAILVGEVINITTRASKNKLDGKYKVKNQFIRIKILEKIKGKLVQEEVTVRSPTGHSDCAYFFKEGEKYLIFTTKERGYELFLPYFSENLFTDRCTRTKKLRDSDKDLEILRETFTKSN